MDTEYNAVVQINGSVRAGSHVCISSGKKDVNLTLEMQTWAKTICSCWPKCPLIISLSWLGLPRQLFDSPIWNLYCIWLVLNHVTIVLNDVWLIPESVKIRGPNK